MPGTGIGIGVKVKQSKLSPMDIKYVTDITFNTDKALHIFKKKIKESKLMIELSDRQSFTKPSLKKRLKRIKAISRNKFLNNVSKDN